MDYSEASSGGLRGAADDQEAVYAARGERALIAALEQAHATGSIAAGRPIDVVTVRLDTFDKRLERRGVRLVQEADLRGERCHLVLADGREWRLGEGSGPEFARDLSEGPAREVIYALAGERRLLEIMQRAVRRQPLRLLDSEGKTVVRAFLERGLDPASESEERRLVLRRVRGYEGALRDLKRALDAQPGLQRVDASALTAGPSQDRPQGAPAPKLDPTAASGLAGLLADQFRELLRQEDGVRRDLDAEFLHDYRVALRRARSVLGDLPGALALDRERALRAELRWIAGLTGPLRDADVLLEHLRTTEGLQATELEPMLATLAERRRGLRAELLRALESARYGALIAAWVDLARPPLEVGRRGQRPLRRRLLKRLSKRLTRLRGAVRSAARAAARIPAESLHDLRIEAKRLRYLLECSTGLVPARDLTRALRLLKELQEHLGAFHDAVVQEHLLLDLGRELGSAGAPTAALLSVGRLAERAAQRAQSERAALPHCWAEFGARRARRAFERVLAHLDGAV